jgi:ABC-type branched-subunit amino acid transport system substrate-binding protein
MLFMNHRANIFLFPLLMFFIGGAVGQEQFAYSPIAEQKFSRALQFFKTGNYSDAASIFDELVELQPVHQRTTAALLMAARAHFQQGEYSRSLDLLTDLLNGFPESAYSDEAHYTLGLSYFMMKRYRDAASELLHVIQSAHNTTTVEGSFSLLDSGVTKHLSVPDFQIIIPTVRQQDARNLLSLKLAEKFCDARDFGRALEVIDGQLKQRPVGTYVDRLQQLQFRLAHLDSIKVKVGVILPTTRAAQSTGLKTFSKEILEGITFASDLFNEHAGSFVKVTLDIRDTEHDTTLSKRVLREFSRDKDVVAVIGPMFSDVAVACAPVANAEHIPLLSPTANETGITKSGPYMFQLSPDLAMHGKAMARYAIQEMGLKKLAVLAPSDPTVIELVDQFVGEARRLGADVVAVESYAPDSTELREQFMDLRRAAAAGDARVSFLGKMQKSKVESILHAGADPKLVDSLLAKGGDIGVINLLGPRGRHIADSLHLRLNVPLVPDDDIENPVTAIDGIFVPLADAEQIGIVASQMAYFNIKTRTLGSTAWYDLTQLEAQKRYVDGVVFCSETYVDREDSAYGVFKNSFTGRMGEPPTKYALVGFDATNLLLSVIQDGARTREDIARSLGTVEGFHGFHATVSFDNRRVNAVMNVLKYHKSEIRKIGEISVK